ncbi:MULTISPECIES: hypothetical protein [unclassified Streptomyces]|uniref:hypothetical protein n=1 Tax=unclassified Streptomyces TaxID=2593676 RepID=UPI0037B995D9
MSGDGEGAPRRRPRRLERAQVGPGPLRGLKDLLHRVYPAAGAPTLDEIVEDIAADDSGRALECTWTSAASTRP